LHHKCRHSRILVPVKSVLWNALRPGSRAAHSCSPSPWLRHLRPASRRTSASRLSGPSPAKSSFYFMQHAHLLLRQRSAKSSDGLHSICYYVIAGVWRAMYDHTSRTRSSWAVILDPIVYRDSVLEPVMSIAVDRHRLSGLCRHLYSR
jgi:hypothetical protein